MAIPVSAELLQQLMVASLDTYLRDEVARLDIQEKPLLSKLAATSRPFTGGKERIVYRVSFGSRPAEKGFQGDQILEFSNSSNLREASVRWYNRHIGLSVGIEELQRNGLTIVDADRGMDIRNQAGAASVQLANLFEEKLADLRLGREESRNLMFWRDGSANPLDVPGIMYWVQDDPTIPAVVGGIDQGANPEWRNRALLNINATEANASDLVLMQTLQKEWRRLTRYGFKPNTILAGEEFITQLEYEYQARGQFFMEGFSRGSTEIGKGEFTFKGIPVTHDPTLDDLGRSKYCYILNLGRNGIWHMYMDGWKDRQHKPARPENKMVFFMSLTTVDALACRDRRSQGVYSIV